MTWREGNKVPAYVRCDYVADIGSWRAPFPLPAVNFRHVHPVCVYPGESMFTDLSPMAHSEAPSSLPWGLCTC